MKLMLYPEARIAGFAPYLSDEQYRRYCCYIKAKKLVGDYDVAYVWEKRSDEATSTRHLGPQDPLVVVQLAKKMFHNDKVHNSHVQEQKLIKAAGWFGHSSRIPGEIDDRRTNTYKSSVQETEKSFTSDQEGDSQLGEVAYMFMSWDAPRNLTTTRVLISHVKELARTGRTRKKEPSKEATQQRRWVLIGSILISLTTDLPGKIRGRGMTETGPGEWLRGILEEAHDLVEVPLYEVYYSSLGELDGRVLGVYRTPQQTPEPSPATSRQPSGSDFEENGVAPPVYPPVSVVFSRPPLRRTDTFLSQHPYITSDEADVEKFPTFDLENWEGA